MANPSKKQVKKSNRYLEQLGILSNLCDIKDKEGSVDYYVLDMLNRAQSIFRYNGLPESVPQRELELMLQCNGNVFWTEWEGNLYVVTGGLGGEPNAYYFPTMYTIANPYLKLNKNAIIGEDGILMKNDTMMMGLLPIFRRYATFLAENDITLRLADINMRTIALITAPDDNARDAAIAYLKQVEDGDMGVIADNTFLEGIKSQPYLSGMPANYVTQLIELHQYHAAGWKNAIGLDANFNMKRETLTDGETAQNEPTLRPLIDDMLRQRKEALERVNEMFGTDISVELSSAWEIEKETQEAEIEALESESDEPIEVENEEVDDDARDENTE